MSRTDVSRGKKRSSKTATSDANKVKRKHVKTNCNNIKLQPTETSHVLEERIVRVKNKSKLVIFVKK